MKTFIRLLALPALSSLLLCSIAAQAASVDYPILDIQASNGDLAMYGDGTTLAMDASLLAQTLNSGDTPIPLAGNVSLSAEFVQVSNGHEYHFNNGLLAITNSDQNLLMAEFEDLIISTYSGGFATFEAQLTYTGGSLFTSTLDANGQLNGSAAGLSSINLDAVFSSTNLVMAVGDIAPVPLPAAFWMMACGLMSLAGFRLRKQSA